MYFEKRTTRWTELQAAQHRQMGMVSYPWNDVYGQMRRIPMDCHMLESYTKTQYHFTAARTALRHADKLVLADIRDPNQLERVTESVTRLNDLLGQIDSDKTAEFVNPRIRH